MGVKNIKNAVFEIGLWSKYAVILAIRPIRIETTIGKYDGDTIWNGCCALIDFFPLTNIWKLKTSFATHLFNGFLKHHLYKVKPAH